MPHHDAKSRPGSWNPLSFRPAQVTTIGTLLYLALLAVVLWVHLSVPPAPSDPIPEDGLNLTRAWLDLEELSRTFRPWNSHRNEVVRDWLVERVRTAVDANGKSLSVLDGSGAGGAGAESDVVVWKDKESNVTFVDDWRKQPWTVYTEGQNVVVYIRGSEDEEGAWWNASSGYKGEGGVLVNAHYDSVSTGYGATDDGIGVVTILQLISYFTVEGQRPPRGIIALLNNGEEDGLYGAHAFLRHRVSEFPRVFLNLEGAGAGGRATLFRSTDAEVTNFYARAKHPFGSVVSADGFKRGFVKSGTDYSVFTENLGLRGLDVAFMAPRSRYHTDQDDARDTDGASLWHMLSTALSTTKAMTWYVGDDFEGSSSGSDGVWFDVLGSAFAVMKLHALFAVSVALLVAGPITFILLEVLLVRQGKWYPFARKGIPNGPDDDDELPIALHGFRGFFRFPLSGAIAIAAAVALAFLLTKINPYIIYRSPFAVWALLLSAFFIVAWFLLNLGDRIRPTALMRWYSFLWIYLVSWIALVLSTVGANNFGVGSGYFLLIYHASIYLAFLVGYLEFFALPKIEQYVEHAVSGGEGQETRPGSASSRRMLDQAGDQAEPGRSVDSEEATERTSLLKRANRRDNRTFTGFARRRTQDPSDLLDEDSDPLLRAAYPGEQAWSGALPSWTWILQYLLVVPINVILVGQIGLLLTSSLHQTPADGNPVLPIYLLLTACVVGLLAPLLPFLQRFTFHLPLLLMVVFVGCLLSTLLAFPFDREARMKYYFLQSVDLKTGANEVSLSGLDPYVRDIVAEMPSAAGQSISCGGTQHSLRIGLTTCQWHGLDPKSVSNTNISALDAAARYGYSDWVDYNVTVLNSTSALFTLRGRNTKNCRISFSTPVHGVSIADAASDDRHESVAKDGSTQLLLFSREWDKEFRITVSWAEGESVKGQEGKIGCMWAEAEKVPALMELKRYEPVWSVATKQDAGLVEGWLRWTI